MVRLHIEARHPDGNALAQAAETIAAGGVVAYPTDTLYGLAVDPRQPAAIDALYRIKGRDAMMPIPLVAASEAQVESCVGRLSALARRLAGAHWPGPLTLVVDAAPGLAAALHSADGKVAVRVPAHEVARALPALVGYVVTSTSANPSGFAPPYRPDDVVRMLGNSVDLLLDGGLAPGGPPSTVVDASGREPVLIRAGAVPWERVLESVHGT